jgi:heat shock protein HtpX
MQPFFIESPALLPESGLFATHPPVEDRIEALIEFAGGQDLPPPRAPPEPAPQPPGQASFLPPGVERPQQPFAGPWG